MSRPELGLATEVEIVDRQRSDADTIRVRVTREFNVRLCNTSCPEKNTEAGRRAKSYVNALMPVGSKATLFVPTGNALNLMDINSFERVLGELWLTEDLELGRHLNDAGFGRPVKEMG